MGATEFGRLMGRAMAERGISQNRLASRLGELPDGRIFDATQIRLIRQGRRRLDHQLVQRLIELLDLDPAEAWATAGLWPPDLDMDGYRRHRLTARSVGQTALPVPVELQDAALLRRLGVPNLERRRVQRRRRLRLVPQVERRAA